MVISMTLEEHPPDVDPERRLALAVMPHQAPRLMPAIAPEPRRHVERHFHDAAVDDARGDLQRGAFGGGSRCQREGRRDHGRSKGDPSLA